MKLVLLLLAGFLSLSCGYHILCVFPVPSHSHNQLGKGFVEALLKSGHTVTWITPYPEKVGKDVPKTLKVFDVSEVQKLMDDADPDMVQAKDVRRGLAYVKEFSKNITKSILTNSAVVDMLVKVQFDAVVTESFFCDVMAGIAAVQQVPWIIRTSSQMMVMLESQVDEVRSLSTVPIMFHDANIPMSLKERAVNAFMFIFMAFNNWLERPATETLYKQLFSPIASARNVSLPRFEDAYHNVSILFLNSHEALSPAFSVPPNVVQIAGFHIDENPPPLPKDLQHLLDNSKNGVIYFSMGSIVRSADLPPHTRQALLAIFAKLTCTVLWKFEEKIERLPPNVHIRSWMPQQRILEHPNVKVFITHGGQLSTLEAIHAGVPLLAIPVFGDQPANAERAVKDGYALRVTFDPNMAAEIDVKLKELLNNPSYNERAKFLSKLFRGGPVAPSRLVSHYVELAIETKGAPHLRSLSLRYSWVQRWMLDVIVLVIAASAICVSMVALLVRMCHRKLYGKTTNKIEKKNLNKKKN